VKKLALLFLAATAPLTAATFTVTNTDDSGPGSLRQAIDDANATPGADTIAFAIPGGGVHTITPQTLLPIINEAVLIDGYTQPGSSPNTNATGALNSVLQIEIDGTVAPNRCVTIGASNVEIRGLVINRCGESIELFNPFGASVSGIVIAGNFLGTDASGLASASNQTGVSCGTQGGTVSFTVGGLDPEDRNLISGNAQVGIRTGSNFNGGSTSVIQGNIIGLDKNAAAPIPNQFGIINNDGGPTTMAIGGLTPEAANIISGNATGVYVVGTVNTSIRGNSIFDNALLGIKASGLSDFSLPLPNDPGDADGGGNSQQNFPIVSSVDVTNGPSGGSTHIVAVLHSTPSTGFDIDFYANPACTNFPREFLEGKTYLGSTQVDTDGSGTAVIDVTLPVTVEPGARINATATNPAGGTSEFSQRIPFSMHPPSGDPAGGAQLGINGTDMLDGATVTVGGVAATDVNLASSVFLNATAPALPAGTVNDVVVTNTDGSSGTLTKGYVSNFLDVNGFHQFHPFVTTLVSNAITVGVGGGLFGVDQPTLRQQMAVFLLKGKHGLCYVPPPCQGDFADVPCPSTFADWIEALAEEGITGGCGGGNFCPGNAVRRDQMAPFLLKAEHGSSYVPPPCAGTFPDVTCPSLFADWIEQLAAEEITGGCGGGNYCPLDNSTRGQMAVFVVKTFNLQ
jgi:hypothetical protein